MLPIKENLTDLEKKDLYMMIFHVLDLIYQQQKKHSHIFGG